MTAAVQQERATDTASSVSSLALAFVSNVLSGSAVHAIGTSANTATHTCADNVNGTYGAALDSVNDTNNSQRMTHFKFNNAASGATTVTLTNSVGAVFVGIWIKEISGVTTTAFDKSNAQLQGNPGTAADGVSSLATATLTTQPALVSGLSFNDFSNAAPAVGTGFTDGGTGWTFGGGSAGARSESKRVTATTGVAATFTASADVAHMSCVAVFTETAAGGATRPVKMAGEWNGYAGRSGGFAG